MSANGKSYGIIGKAGSQSKQATENLIHTGHLISSARQLRLDRFQDVFQHGLHQGYVCGILEAVGDLSPGASNSFLDI